MPWLILPVCPKLPQRNLDKRVGDMAVADSLATVLRDSMSWTALILLLSATTVIYFVCEIVYQLYFSPLAKFPGPKLAAATRLYELYYDLALGGQYTFRIRDMHKQYGASPP